MAAIVARIVTIRDANAAKNPRFTTKSQDELLTQYELCFSANVESFPWGHLAKLGAMRLNVNQVKICDLKATNFH